MEKLGLWLAAVCGAMLLWFLLIEKLHWPVWTVVLAGVILVLIGAVAKRSGP